MSPMAMQGSSIAGIDVGGASVKLNEDGSYTLGLGCADMVQAVIRSWPRWLRTAWRLRWIILWSSAWIRIFLLMIPAPYASATTYATGTAVVNACRELREKICSLGALMLESDPANVDFDGEYVYAGENKVSLRDIAVRGTCGNTQELQVTPDVFVSHLPAAFYGRYG